MREIENHPILEFKRGEKIEFTFEGKTVFAYQGETVAMALYRQGINIFSESTKLHRPRGMFCAIGKCSSCMMRVNGVPNVKTCILPVQAGMIIERQRGFGNKPDKAITFSGVDVKKEEIVIIGGGPAGLSAAITLKENNINPLIIEQNPVLGGQLIKQTHKFFGSKKEKAGTRGIEIAGEMVNTIKQMHIPYLTTSTAFGFYPDKTLAIFTDNHLLKINANYYIFSTGAAEKMIPFEGNDLPGVFGAGAAQTMMNVFGILPGHKVLVVGAGNVGLIVAYQLLQAGIKVEGVIEAAPKIGGYFVHAAKLRRFGIPILTSTTIKKAIGTNSVKKAITVKLNDKFEEIEGSEQEWGVDTICLSTGLIPSVSLLSQAGCKMKYIPQLGGYVPIRNEFSETTLNNVFVAGDVDGIEEASTAIMEGKIAAYAILKRKQLNVSKKLNETITELKNLRSGPFGNKILQGIKEAQNG